ncbi:MAG: class I SAM-dependent methyltransferase [Actinomycetota bacterium]|nr:class I SAM-dependent methyltransferase [Actinomycetota bacterium]
MTSSTGTPAIGYERRIGRYGPELAILFMKATGVRSGQRALDVGCGGGALTEPLAEVLGPQNVLAADPDAVAVEACRARLPGVDVRVAAVEALPFADHEFDVVLAQLVVSLMSDPHAGAREMRRVARPGGVVATCVWDFGGGMTLLRTFWAAAAALDPAAADYDQAKTRPFAKPGELSTLWHSAGLKQISTGELRVGAGYADFDDLWDPLVAPDGSPGAYYAELQPQQRMTLRQDVFNRLGSPTAAFRLTACAWYVRGRA